MEKEIKEGTQNNFKEGSKSRKLFAVVLENLGKYTRKELEIILAEKTGLEMVSGITYLRDWTSPKYRPAWMKKIGINKEGKIDIIEEDPISTVKVHAEKDSEEVEKFVEDRKEEMDKRNGATDFYYRVSDFDTVQVKILAEEPSYRTIEFLEGETRGSIRQITPEGVPKGKRFPILFEVEKGEGNPKLFSVDGKALVINKRDPKTEHLIPDADPNFVFDKKLSATIIECILLDKSLAIQGEPGTGKTSHIVQIAAKTNRLVIRENFNGNTTPEDFIGKMAFNPERGAYWVDGNCPRACRFGAIYIMDEYDFVQPEYGARLHRVLERNGGRQLSLPENNGEVIECHKNTRFFATGNALFGDAKDRRGSHVGTQDIGAANEDRFDVVAEIGYMTLKQESKIIKRKVPGLKRGHLQTILNVAADARKGFEAGELMETFSLRRDLQWADACRFTKTPMQGAENSFLLKLRGDDKATILDLIKLHSKQV